MGYVDRNLMDGETLYAKAHLHWVIFFKSILFFVIAIALLVYALAERMSNIPEKVTFLLYTGVFFLILGLWYALGAFIKRHSTELAVTSKRVIAKFGFLRLSTIELNHSKVESMQVEQDLLGRMLGYGTLHIHGTGGGVTPIPIINDPLGFRRRAMEAIDDLQKRPL